VFIIAAKVKAALPVFKLTVQTMLSSLVIRAFSAGLLISLAGAGLNAQSSSDSPGGLRIEVPAESLIRIQNQFGEVTTEVWSETFVFVSTEIEDGSSLKRSPVVIENKPKQLGISILRRVTDPALAINLVVKIPQDARVEIVTGRNLATLRGSPASASLRSSSGNIEVQFLEAPNVDINARSVTGSVKSELPQFQTESGHVLQARVGAGGRALKISSQSGAVTLRVVAPTNSPATGRRVVEDRDVLPVPAKAAGVPAPLSETQEIDEGDVIRVDSQMVTVNMSVIDRNTNRGLAGLHKSDFRLFENGTEQNILQFESSAAPFDLLLLIDISGSTRDVLELIRSAALRFVAAARPQDRIGVVTFAGSPTLVSQLTLDRRLLRERINAVETARLGDTKLYDATDFALTQILQEAKTRRRTAVILMSDGLDGSIEGVRGDGSALPYRDLVNRVQEFDGVLYTLWLNTRYVPLSEEDTQEEAFDEGHDQMKEIANVGGGLFYEVKRLEDLAGAYERVVADLGTVYSLAYRPSEKNRDGKWRAIRVNVQRPAAVARGKRGYYAN
jgi:VWFA-related protein